MRKFIYVLAIAFLIYSVIVAVLAYCQGFREGLNFDFEIASQYGSFVGGILSFFSVVLIYYTLRQQKQSFEITSFENRFFQLVDYHRKNVESWEYKNPESKTGEMLKGGKVFICIHREVIKALKILKEDCNICSEKDILKNEEISKLKKNTVVSHRVMFDVFEAELINIAYLIVFIGVSKEGLPVLENILSERCHKDIVETIIKRFKDEETNWDKNEWAKRMQVKKGELKDRYKKRKAKDEHFKYFGGHQHRLGHYYRHMYQTVKYVDNYSPFKGDYKKKYGYVKTYRAQLSTYEQAVFTYNSLSVLGRVWELNEEDKNKHYITKYNLIKNILSEFIINTNLENYYPNVTFEGQDKTEERIALEKEYN